MVRDACTIVGQRLQLATPLRDKEIVVEFEFPPSTLAPQGRGVSFSSSTPFSGPLSPLPSRNTPLIHTLVQERGSFLYSANPSPI